ncbi:hypothetical protein B0H11DRAFT_2253459 [Mycena galericulata]|nr:hypothetical protein B0H11DRAFT_2253459 [Mycena galericulata]
MGSGQRHANLDDLNLWGDHRLPDVGDRTSRRVLIEAQLALCRAYAAYFKDNLPKSEAAKWELVRFYRQYLQMMGLLAGEHASDDDAGLEIID